MIKGLPVKFVDFIPTTQELTDIIKDIENIMTFPDPVYPSSWGTEVKDEHIQVRKGKEPFLGKYPFFYSLDLYSSGWKAVILHPGTSEPFSKAFSYGGWGLWDMKTGKLLNDNLGPY